MSADDAHDVVVDVILNDEARYDDSPITDNFAGVIFSAGGRNFEGMLDLRKIPALYKHKTYRVPVFLVDRGFSSRFLKPGVKFNVWKGVIIGEGSVVSNEVG